MEPHSSPSLLWAPLLLSALLAGLSFGFLLHSLRKIRSRDKINTLGWGLAGTVTTACGLWSSQVAALSAMALPWELYFRTEALGLSAAACLVTSALVLASGRLSLHPRGRMTLLAGQIGLLWSLCLWLGLRSLGTPPTGHGAWWLALVLPPMVVVVGALAAAWLALSPRWHQMGPANSRLWLGALLFGLTAGMAQDIALGAQHFVDTLGNVNGLLDVTTAQLAASAGCIVLLLGVFGVMVDNRAHGQNRMLANSLSEANRRLREQALTDPLTRLANRNLFEERLEELLTRLGDEPGSLAVLFIDLDGFKPVNDSFGHVAGDSVLREIGQRLKATARPTDLVARIGGDEFLVLAEMPGGTLGAGKLAQTALDTVSKPYVLPNGVHVTLSCSVGIVMYPDHGPSQKLIANADAAMYAAKRAGGSTFAFFEPSMDHDAREQLQLQHDLRSALDRHELELYYQPKIDGYSSQITGVEALVRWHHPTRGLMMPGVFIPIAERFGLIGALGGWVLDEACRQLQIWQNQGLRMRVSVNLTPQQLQQDDLMDRIHRAVTRHKIDRRLLTLEITESVFMQNKDAALRVLTRLAQDGITLSLDDFGTEYSSYAVLSEMPVHQLKIDRHFVMKLGTSLKAEAIVDGIIHMAHALNLRVVAEGVETEEQRDTLVRLACDELQGYLFAKPMPADRLTLWAMGDDTVHGSPDFRPSLYDDGTELLTAMS
ncbi:MAG: bifunctional diguanylate cyclase/phosphodiesterase [Burkholderiales bacterium PBB6]|nr:MAG: bifunctional diguanylate cyclase/phosphodiesterase [Burkholderiales bacterium PBB6]